MVSPVWIDGPLEGKQHEVTAAAVEQGMYQLAGTETIYTFGLLDLLQRRIVFASVQPGPVTFDVLFAKIITPEAQRAVQ